MSRATADAARRDDLALVGVLAEQFERFEAKGLVLSPLTLHDSRQQLGPRARVCRDALVDRGGSDEHLAEVELRRREALVGYEAVVACSLAEILQQSLAPGMA